MAQGRFSFAPGNNDKRAMKKLILLALCLCSAAGFSLRGQEFSLSSNLLDWANLGTANLQAGISFSRHLSLHAGARYNNWNFGSQDTGTAFQNRARAVSLGARYWPWNVYSSWWFGTKCQLEEYNRGGLFKKPLTEEGVAAGLGLAFGYSRMLTRHWNLDIGLGGWAGKAWYAQYRCPRCGRIVKSDAQKWFIRPSSDIQLSFAYIF